MTKTIVKLTLSEQIYNILRDDILVGTIPLGGKLTNRELQERFQVSSTPVRDAINRLFQNGLVTNVTKTGAQIISFDPDYAKEVNEFISALACEAVTLASLKGEQYKITDELYRWQKAMIDAKDNDSYFQADNNYHDCFFLHCENRFLIETYKRYNLLRLLLTQYAIRTPGEKSSTIQQHKAITEAYAKGDIDLAKQLVNQHYQYGIRQINEYFQNP